jgi:hypothetical protein
MFQSRRLVNTVGDEVEVAGPGDGLGSTVHAELLVGALSSLLRRTARDRQLVGDISETQRCGQIAEHIRLRESDRRCSDDRRAFRHGLCSNLVDCGDEQPGDLHGIDRLMRGRLFDQACGNERAHGFCDGGGTDHRRCFDGLCCSTFGRDGCQYRPGFILLGGGDHFGRFVDRREFGLDEEPSLGRQESFAEKSPAGLGEGVQQRPRPRMFDEQERDPSARPQRLGQGPNI